MAFETYMSDRQLRHMTECVRKIIQYTVDDTIQIDQLVQIVKADLQDYDQMIKELEPAIEEVRQSGPMTKSTMTADQQAKIRHLSKLLDNPFQQRNSKFVYEKHTPFVSVRYCERLLKYRHQVLGARGDDHPLLAEIASAILERVRLDAKVFEFERYFDERTEKYDRVVALRQEAVVFLLYVQSDAGSKAFRVKDSESSRGQTPAPVQAPVARVSAAPAGKKKVLLTREERDSRRRQQIINSSRVRESAAPAGKKKALLTRRERDSLKCQHSHCLTNDNKN